MVNRRMCFRRLGHFVAGVLGIFYFGVDSLLVLRHLERQIKNGVPMKNIALDRGYDTGAVHRGLELLGITGYIPAIQFSNSPEKYGFSYLPQEDAFSCPEGVRLVYQ